MPVSNKNNQFWRNEQGKAQCAGDMCPVDCDAKCPLWLSTIALEKLQGGNLKEAIYYFKNSLAIDSEIPETYNNMGMAYGFSDNHKEAYNAFKKALELRPNYDKALSGLIVAEKKLGMYEEALAHCDELAKYPDNNAVKLRKDIIELQKGNASDSKKTIGQTELLLHLLKKGRESGYIQSEGLVHIPEVMVESKSVSANIMRDLIPSFKSERLSWISTSLAWSAYAGIGAVYFWSVDWNALEANGVYRTLSSARGIEEMDEYVMDSIGIGFGTPEEKEISEFLRSLTYECMALAISPTGEDVVTQLLDSCCAMYNFGMVFEMNRLGMK